MLHISSLDDAQDVFKALSTPARLEIMKMIYKNDNLSMNDLAKALGLTNSAISMHVSKLEKAGLAYIQITSGKRGTRKLVRPCCDRLLIDMAPETEDTKYYQDDIKIGYFSSYSVTPTCGMANSTGIIGSLDDIRVFTFPEHFGADILWFGSGYVEYRLPNHLQPGQELKELQISFEISSECPGVNNIYPSDIYFYLNDIPLGMWISPGDFGGRRGHVSPSWWPLYFNQYGLLKNLIINREGTFMDGSDRLSGITVDDLRLDHNSTMTFRIEAPIDTTNSGGCTLFGETFGDHCQSIRVKAFY